MSRHRHVTRAVVAGLVWVALVLGGSPAGLAAETGVIQGRLVNGSAGGAAPAQTEVVLHQFRGEAHAEDRPAQTGPDGAFTFDGVDTSAGLTYQVTASYGGTTYTGDSLEFLAGEREKSLELRVYESTNADPGLRIRRASVILMGADATSQTVQVVELVTFENPSDRTYLPSATGPAGPMGLLRFPLPPQAGSLERGPGLENAEIVQVDRGFAADLPLLPGTRDVLFSYRFPYRAGRVAFPRSVSYPTAELRVLAPRPGPTVASPGLQPGEPLPLGGRTYQVLLARDLSAGRQVEMVFEGLPSRWPLGLPLDAVPIPVWGGVGAALALLVAGGYAWRARRVIGAPDAAALATADREALLAALASLDEAYGSGQLAAEPYRARRAEAKARLLDLLRAGGSAPAVHAGSGDA